MLTQFLPAIESLMLDEQIRSHTLKLPDSFVESAEDIPSSLHNMITDNETAAYIMVYYASHGMSQVIAFLYINAEMYGLLLMYIHIHTSIHIQTTNIYKPHTYIVQVELKHFASC